MIVMTLRAVNPRCLASTSPQTACSTDRQQTSRCERERLVDSVVSTDSMQYGQATDESLWERAACGLCCLHRQHAVRTDNSRVVVRESGLWILLSPQTACSTDRQQTSRERERPVDSVVSTDSQSTGTVTSPCTPWPCISPTAAPIGPYRITSADDAIRQQWDDAINGQSECPGTWVDLECESFGKGRQEWSTPLITLFQLFLCLGLRGRGEGGGGVSFTSCGQGGWLRQFD